MTGYDDDQALTLNELADLMDRLDVVDADRATLWFCLRQVLDWGGRHELFTMAGTGRVETMTHEAAMAEARAPLERLARRDALHAQIRRSQQRLNPDPDTGAAMTGDMPAGTPAAPSPAAPEGMLPPDDRRWPRSAARCARI